MTPFIIWMYIRGEILLIYLWSSKWVLLSGIWLKSYQMKPADLFFTMISKYGQNYHGYFHKKGDEKSFTTYLCTETRKNMNLPYSIRMYWTNFWQPTVHAQQHIYKSWKLTYLRFFWHLLRPNWSIIRGTVSLWKMYENGKIAVFEGKWRRFRILPKV